VWWLVAFVVLLAGYADLWRGGETIAPLLLVLGYCVFVPLAILRSPGAGGARSGRAGE
jgi:hypothetical protein